MVDTDIRQGNQRGQITPGFIFSSLLQPGGYLAENDNDGDVAWVFVDNISLLQIPTSTTDDRNNQYIYLYLYDLPTTLCTHRDPSCLDSAISYPSTDMRSLD